MTVTDAKFAGRFTVWFVCGLLAFAAAGTADWALAAVDSTGVGGLGLAAGWVVFVSLWMLGGTAWAIGSGLLLWGATGNPSTASLLDRLRARLKLWCKERHDEADASRLATLLVAMPAAALFAVGSVVVTAHLIEERNVPWLIAAFALVAQIGLAAGLFVVGLAARRGLKALLAYLKRFQFLRWLHTPAVIAASGACAVVAGLYVAVSQRELLLAIEGPAVGLAVAAVLIHPLIDYVLNRPLLRLAPPLRYGMWALPLAALFCVGAVSQQPEARRLLVLHGETAHFAFNAMQRHSDLDRIFNRSDCPPLGPDGLPIDGTTNEEYEEQCMDSAYDRPFHRQEIPPYDRPEFEERPSFVFITWDSVRVDRLGYMDHYRDTTPNLDAFAERSLVFDRAFAADSGTGPSFWSLMTGKTPFQVRFEHGNRFPPPMVEDEQLLGELLSEAGYRTKAVMCGSVFGRDTWDIRRGFERFENVCGRQRHHLAPMVTEESVETLQRLSDEDAPFFLWVHYYDPHTPYTDHPEIGYGEERLDRYDEELTYTDEHMQPLLDALDEVAKDYDRPLFTIFSADHGENFDEHGSDPHARNLYRIVTQVPKIVHGPGIEPGRIDPPVALNDVYPTVLDLAGIDIPHASTMVSQVPVYYGAEPDEDRMVFQENSYSRPRRHTRAVVWRRYHYIMDLTTNSNELYDYVDDPIERNNLIGTGLIEERIMRQALVRFLQTSTIPEGLED